MISDKMTDAINGQINAELYSAYLYMSMSTWCSVQGLAGAANWMMIQAKEEMTHVQRFHNYVNAQGKLEGFTALMTAAAEGHVKIVELLLAHGADATMTDTDGDTAASFARQKGHGNLAELLEGTSAPANKDD